MRKRVLLMWLRRVVSALMLIGITATLIYVPVWTPIVLTVLAVSGLLLAPLMGRWYCAIGCPFGILQEWIGGLIWLLSFGRRRYRAEPNHRCLRYAVLAAVLTALVVGVMLPLAGLEPYSNFTRIATALFRPAVVGTHNAVAAAPLNERPVGMAASLWAAGCLALLIGVVWWKGRIFCQTLCPIGGILGLLSRRARMRLQVDPARCVKCMKCVGHCPSGCLTPRGEGIDAERCTWCLGCLGACRFDAIRVAPVPLPPVSATDAPLDGGRRVFLWSAGAAALGAAVAAGVKIQRSGRLAGGAALPVMPPGAGDMAEFTRRCTACHLCIGACTGKVLTPAGLEEYGWAGVGQPYLDFRRGMCEFQCTNCSSVCPTGALHALGRKEKQLLRIGLAHYRRDNCVVFLDRDRDCGACAEHCPTGALQMRVTADGYRLPFVIEELCIGCGSCVKACPQHSDCPLTVSGVAVQQKATDPADYFKSEKKDTPAMDSWAF